MQRAVSVLFLAVGIALGAACSIDDLPANTSTTGDADTKSEAGDAVSEDVVADGSVPDAPTTCDEPTACYEGPAGTLDIGVCHAGLGFCGSETGAGVCVGQVLPATADCKLDALDTDCDDRTGAHVWSKRFGDSSLQRLQHLAVDATGNVFATGYSYGSIPLSASLTLSPGFFLFKLNATGGVEWGKSWPNNLGVGVTAMPNGDVVLAGAISGPTNFGGAVLVPPNSGSPEPMLARFEGSGNHAWSRLTPARVEAVIAKSATELIAGGTFGGALDWSGAPALQAETVSDLVIASLKAENGDANWVRGYGGNANVARLALDSQHNVLVVGRLLGFADLGGGSIGDGSVVSYVAKLDALGNHLWSKAFGPVNQYYGTPGVAVAPDDSIWVAVPFQGAFQLDGKSFTSQGAHDVLVVRFDAGGSILAERQLGDAGHQFSWDVQSDADGNAVVGGGFSGSIDVGACAITNQGGYYDAFLIKLDTKADPMWLHAFGDATDSGFEGLPDDVFFALAKGPGGSIVAGGQFDGIVDFGGGGLVDVGAGSTSNDIVIARYQQ